MPPISKISSTNNNNDAGGGGSTKKKRKGVLPFGLIVIILSLCCMLSLAVSFLNGSLLHGLPEIHATTAASAGGRGHLASAAALKSSLLESISSNAAGGAAAVDHQRPAINGGDFRPILPSDLRLGKLSCEKYGGPSDEDAKEMVYWQDIPEDSKHKSPFLKDGIKRYMTFEPDAGGFNNIRMSMETVFGMAHAMGRTLVLPPEQRMYLLTKRGDDQQKKDFGFQDFFPINDIFKEQEGIDVITMEEFLLREGVTGRLKDKTGAVTYPPGNRTNWNGDTNAVNSQLSPWLHDIAYAPNTWSPDTCMAAFPSTADIADTEILQTTWENIIAHGLPPIEAYIGRPTPVQASFEDRMKENAKEREHLCIYNQTMQQEPLVHFSGKKEHGGRLLVNFYAFLFFQDWKEDLWMKRFIRDHIRYVDEIQCAAARIVHAVRERAKKQDPNNSNDEFDSFHVRRGDFQYKKTRVSAQELYDISKDELTPGTTVYMATDERDKSFFKNLSDHYDVVYLDDFAPLLKGVNTNFYGMIDQLIASRSRVFFGCWFSTFTGYINRIRGYHADRLKLPGFETGITNSYYYALPQFKTRMRQYWPLSGAHHSREFPVSWRNIDHGIGELTS